MQTLFLVRPCGNTIYYTVRGRGRIPVLCISPGGMRSNHEKWKAMPWNPVTQLSGDHFRIICMDQRNAGRSIPGPLGSGWDTYVQDQLAVLDKLGIDRCLTVGACIGPSYQLRLMKEAPERFPAAVMMQPIGIAQATTETPGWVGLNKAQTRAWFQDWANELMADSRATAEELEALNSSMFGEGSAGFAFSVSDDDIREVKAALLVLAGIDAFHPAEAARQIARLAPRASLIEGWKGIDEIEGAARLMENFLCDHGATLLQESRPKL